MASLTVGRKFTESVCRRAVCCRIGGKSGNGGGKRKWKRKTDEIAVVGAIDNITDSKGDGDTAVEGYNRGILSESTTITTNSTTTPTANGIDGDGDQGLVVVDSTREGGGVRKRTEDLGYYRLNHPAIMGTAVYLDDAGT